MFVARRMRKNIVTAAPSASLFEAQRMMREHTIRQIPVVSEDGTLLGDRVEVKHSDEYVAVNDERVADAEAAGCPDAPTS